MHKKYNIETYTFQQIMAAGYYKKIFNTIVFYIVSIF